MADVRTPELVINKLTKQQYENIQNPSDTELYLVQEDEEHKPICYPTTASEVTTTSMLVKSSVDGNGRMLTENGFVYNTIGNPTISDTKVICDLGVGQFEKKLENLTLNTEYHIKSYGQNSSGLVYGSELVQRTINNPIPAEYQLVEYLKSTGTEYIITYYVFNVGDKINISFTTLNLSNYKILFGSDLEFQCFLNAGNNDGFFCYGYNGSTARRIHFASDTHYEINIENNLCYLNGTDISNNVSFGNVNSTLSTALFTRNKDKIHLTPLQIDKFIVERNNTLYFALYPVYRKADNKPGMYDIVNNVFYTNQGTGEFVVGPDKEWDE